MPIPIVSIAQMREWETATWAKGQSESEVIRRVGRAIAEQAVRLTRPGDMILVLAGKGNNGADARAALEHFDERPVDVLDVHDPEADLAELETLLALRPALVVDGLFGIGINRPLDMSWRKLIQRINDARLNVLAIDVPSGLNADTGEPEGAAVEAAVTLTVGAPKAGLLRKAAWPYVGRLEVAPDVGLLPCPVSSECLWTTAADFAGFPPRRPADSHKGTFGHLAILAGSSGYHGAGVLAARGAQRARPGLITLFPQESVYQPCAAQLQAVMVQPWTQNIDLQNDFSAILAGPGLAGAETLKDVVARLWSGAQVPVVVDASGLAWLPPGETPAESVRVITPHPGEAARLLKITSAEVQADRPSALRALSGKFGGCWVVLKGQQTLVGRNIGSIFVNSSGNPGLAQGGSGDLLAGFIAGFLAQGPLQTDPLTTLRFAVWQHGAAADALEKVSRNWVVEDLAEELGARFPP